MSGSTPGAARPRSEDPPHRSWGTPVLLDVYLKPAARMLQLTLVVPATAAIAWFEAWWWLPVPAIVAIGVFEAWFWSRGDRPTLLTVSADTLTLDDPVRGDTLTVDLATIEVATTSWRRVRGGREAVVMLADASGPQVALRLTDAGSPRGEDVDIDAMDAILGGQAGVLRSVAPFDRVARQGFADPVLLDRIRGAVPPEAWRRTGSRVWRGASPPLSPFGFHLHDPTGWLVLDGSGWVLRDEDGAVLGSGSLGAVEISAIPRQAMLVVRDEEGVPHDELTEIPTIGITLAPDLRVRFPAPDLSGAPTGSASDTDLHAHAAEGAALVDHLRAILGDDGLPRSLVTPPDRSTRPA